MSTLEHLKRIRALLAESRQAMWDGCVNLASGKVDDADTRDAIAQHDESIAWLDNTINGMES